MAEGRRFFSLRDIGLALFFCAAALILWLVLSSSAAGSQASVYLHDERIGQIDLSVDGIVSFAECPQVSFEVKDGAVAFHTSDCRDRTCIRTGFLSHPGQTAVCLPNEIVLRIDGAEPETPDIILR